MIKGGLTQNVNTLIQGITSMKQYEDKSLEVRVLHACMLLNDRMSWWGGEGREKDGEGKDRERERGRGGSERGEEESECVYVCVSVCV